MNIKILGPGCSNCKKQLEITKEAISELNIEVELDYVTDMLEMVSYGVMSTPGIVINDKVVSQGRVVNKEDVIKLINNDEIKEVEETTCSCGGNC